MIFIGVIVLIILLGVVFILEKKKKKKEIKIEVVNEIKPVIDEPQIQTVKEKEKEEEKDFLLGVWVEIDSFDDSNDFHLSIEDLNHKKNTILIVDDSLVVRKKMLDVLNADYNLIIKHNGQEALDYLMNGDTPNLIITDIEMPIMDGVELINKVKASALNRIPILVVSSHVEIYVELMEKELINGFIIKPFSDEDLKAQIKYLIKEK